jgi:hypothetical protein
MPEAEDLWWFDDHAGIVAFTVRRGLKVEYDAYRDCWRVEADGKGFSIPMETVSKRRYHLPIFRDGGWVDSSWAVMPGPGSGW